MAGSIFIEQLKRSWRTMLIIAGVLAFLAFYVAAVVQDADALAQYQELLGQLPPALLGVFGVANIDSMTSVDGFISFAFFSYGILVVAAFSVVAGLNIIANDEDEGSMDVVLALPVPRWRVIVEKYAAYTLLAVLLPVASYLGILGGVATMPAETQETVRLGRLAYACANMLPTMMAIMAFTVFASAIFSRRMIATGLSAGFVVLSYFLYIVQNAASGTIPDGLGRLSVFSYFDAENVVLEGVNIVNVIVLLTIAIVFLAMSAFTFERRDIA